MLSAAPSPDRSSNSSGPGVRGRWTVRLSRDSVVVEAQSPRLGRITVRVQRDGRRFTVDVVADGAGVVSHAGAALLAETADRVGLTDELSRALEEVRERRGQHDPGRVVRDLAVMLADGGDCLADLRAVRDQEPLFGAVASDSTAFRLIDTLAGDPELLGAVRVARSRARANAWAAGVAPARVVIDIDATLITAHSEKQRAAGTYKHGFGFHPLLAWVDGTREALAGILRSGNAGANTAADHIELLRLALEQLPGEVVMDSEIVVRTDSAGATHAFTDKPARSQHPRFDGARSDRGRAHRDPHAVRDSMAA